MSEQPKPRVGYPTIAPLVILDIEARIERGIKTYGRPLEAMNGRDALQDAYEEALDQAIYLKQVLEESGRLSGEYVVALEEAVLLLAQALPPYYPERRTVSALLKRIEARRTNTPTNPAEIPPCCG